jgi:hypothetical protein
MVMDKVIGQLHSQISPVLEASNRLSVIKNYPDSADVLEDIRIINPLQNGEIYLIGQKQIVNLSHYTQ